MSIHKAWKVVAVCCGLSSASIGLSINTSGVFYIPVSESLDILKGDFAFHMTLFTLVTAFSSFWIPSLMEKMSFKGLLWLSVIIAVLSTAGMGLARELWQFNGLAIIRGISTSMFSIVPLTILINRWFQAKNGLATSIVLGCTGISGAIFSSIIGYLIQNQGWQLAYYSKAAIMALFCLPALFYPFKVNPADEGQLAFGSRTDADREATVDSKVQFQKASKSTLSLLLLFGFLISFLSSMTQHLPGYVQSFGLTTVFGASLVSAVMMGNVLSKLTIGILCDRIGAFKTIFLMMMVPCMAIIVLLIPFKNFLWVGASFLYGTVYAIGAVALPLLTREIFGQMSLAKQFPRVSFAANFGAAIAFSAIGYIYDFTGSYVFALSLLLAFLIICFGLLTRMVGKK